MNYKGNRMINTINIGERVVVSGFKFPVTVARIYKENAAGEETSVDAEAACIRMELNWGVHGKSSVALHDENKSWYRYSSTN